MFLWASLNLLPSFIKFYQKMLNVYNLAFSPVGVPNSVFGYLCSVMSKEVFLSHFNPFLKPSVYSLIFQYLTGLYDIISLILMHCNSGCNIQYGRFKIYPSCDPDAKKIKFVCNKHKFFLWVPTFVILYCSFFYKHTIFLVLSCAKNP